MKKLIFQDSFLVSGIMCHAGCGTMIKFMLNDLDELKQQQLLPQDALMSLDAEPETLGVHRLVIAIESETDQQIDNQKLSILFKKIVESTETFKVIDPNKPLEESNKINWINILVNVAAMIAIITLWLIFPPSLPLTLGLMALTFVTTAFTARKYLIDFYRNLRNEDFSNMATPITLGWFLSFAHTVYHAIAMPLVNTFSMAFMSFIMPISLITLVNGMDEMKRLVINKSKSMHLQGMKTLFPQMADEYECYEISDEACTVSEILINGEMFIQSKHAIKKGTLIKVKRGTCFPVDGIILQGNTRIDASLLNGEPEQNKKYLDKVPAGAINLGQDVFIGATEDSYGSTVNQLLFISNRARDEKDAANTKQKFIYLYIALIVLAIAASIIAPLAMGIITIPLLLANVTGVLFAICPCTIAIAHQWPTILSIFQRNNKGITMRNANLSKPSEEIHTIVFDKTGTLTTGNSQVDSSEGISQALWERIYLLEKHHGAEHPLAKAICKHYEGNIASQSIFQDIQNEVIDSKNRGLSATIQGNQIHLGNAEFLQQCGVKIPIESKSIQEKLAQGYTPVFVSENKVYQGVIYIKHEVRKDVQEALRRLKKEGKKIIMLTGDSHLSATGFNQHNGLLFESENIHASQTPEAKAAFLEELMTSKEKNPKSPGGVWFVGDGLNDAPCARIVTEKGGVSCAMNSGDKAAYFTDISLNGSLDYLFEHNNLNKSLQKNITQNQWLLAYSALAFLAFIITFSVAGIAVSPLIPLVIMVSTTLLTLFNSYRVKLSVDNALDKKSSWFRKCLASDFSIGLLVGASALFITAILISTVATGGLAFPAMVFTAGALAAVSSTCLLAAGAMMGLFGLLVSAYLVFDKFDTKGGNAADLTHSSGNECEGSGFDKRLESSNDRYGSIFSKLTPISPESAQLSNPQHSFV